MPLPAVGVVARIVSPALSCAVGGADGFFAAARAHDGACALDTHVWSLV